ncbi:MAG: hypothetical protein KAH25_10075, partial [Bacteroidales bacterium]|nr:hypothetical protein [Bacteroidales bacterium]
YSVDISGDNIIVGSYRDDENSQTVFHQKIIKE